MKEVSVQTQSGKIWLVELPESIEELHDPLSTQIRNRDGVIVKPETEDAAELLAVQTAFSIISSEGEAYFQTAEEHAQAIHDAADLRVEYLDTLGDLSWSNLIYFGSAGVIGGALFGGLPGLVVSGYVTYISAINTGRQGLILGDLATVYEATFQNAGEIIVEQNRELLGRYQSTYISPTGVLQGERLWLDLVTYQNNNILLGAFSRAFAKFEQAVVEVLDTAGLGSVPSLVLPLLNTLLAAQSRSFTDWFTPQAAAAAEVVKQVEDWLAAGNKLTPALKSHLAKLGANLIVSDAIEKSLSLGSAALSETLNALDFFLSVVNGLAITAARQQLGEAYTELQKDLVEASKARDDLALISDAAKESLKYRADNKSIYGASEDDDEIVGSSAGDVIIADYLPDPITQGGNDSIKGGGGNDTIYAGAGDDEISGQNGDDLIEPGLGQDIVDTGAGGDTVLGSVEELNGDFVFLDFGDVIEITGLSQSEAVLQNAVFTVVDSNLEIDFEGDGTVDMVVESDLTGALQPVLRGVTELTLSRTMQIQIGERGAFVIDQNLSSGLATGGQAYFGAMTTAGYSYTIGATGISDWSSPEVRNLAVTKSGAVYTIFEYDAGENLALYPEWVLPQLYFDGAGGAIVQLDPETGAFLIDSVRSFSHASGGTTTNRPPDFGIDSVESINALTALDNGKLLAVAEFKGSPYDNNRTLEGGSDFVFLIDSEGNTEFLKNWSGSGDANGTRTVAADTSPTGKVYAWRDYVNQYGGGYLLEINTSTGDPEIVGDFFSSPYEITSIAFQSNGTLLGIGGDQYGSGVIFEIDKSDGTITPLEYVRGEFFPREFDIFGDFVFKPQETGTSDDDDITGSDDGERIEGGPGNDTITALGGDDDIFVGPGTNTVLPGLGDDVVSIFESETMIIGTPEELDGDRILGFDPDDVIRFMGVSFTINDILLSLGSLVVSVDTDGDGIHDTTVTLDGDFEVDQDLIVETDDDGNTTIRLAEPNSAPVALDDTLNAFAGSLTVGSLLDNDSDPDGDAILVTAVDGTALSDPDGLVPETVVLSSGAQVLILGDGTYIYDPLAAFDTLLPGQTGTDTFSYTVEDARGASETATVSVSVTAMDEVIDGTSVGELLLGSAGRDAISAGLGDDTVKPGTGADIVALGGGANLLSGTLDDLDGDTISGFGADDVLRIEGAVLTAAHVSIANGKLIIDVNEDGTPEAEITFNDDLPGGVPLVGSDGTDSTISLQNLFPDLVDDQGVAPGVVNGVLNTLYFTGDGSSGFDIALQDVGYAYFHNTLGSYEVTPTGDVVNVQILFEDTNEAPTAETSIAPVTAGSTLAFFVVQHAAGWAAQLSETDTLEFAGNALDTGTSATGLQLRVNGEDQDRIVFHSIGSHLNPDGLEHALSGASSDASGLTIGFEDWVGGYDLDYEDVVFQVSRVSAEIDVVL